MSPARQTRALARAAAIELLKRGHQPNGGALRSLAAQRPDMSARELAELWLGEPGAPSARFTTYYDETGEKAVRKVMSGGAPK